MLGGIGFDRCEERRRDAGWLEAVRDTGVLISVGSDGSVATNANGGLRLGAAKASEAAMLLCEGDGRAYFAESVDESFTPLRAFLLAAPAAEAALACHASMLTNWHRRNRFCGVCGAQLRSILAGARQQCRLCGEIAFPRVDPVVIMLIEHEDAIFLARQSTWPKHTFSCIAGFVESGESLEQAVARETEEETRLRLHSICYRCSQPWPFPFSVMLGFRAQAREREFLLNHELEDALWISAQDLLARYRSETLRIPPKLAIARTLIDGWLNDAGFELA